MPQPANKNGTFDPEYVEHKFAHDFAIICSIAHIYLTDYKKQLARIETLIANNNCKDLAIASHTLKGAAANFSLTLVTEVAYEMEKLSKAGNFTGAAALFSQLKKEALELDEALTRFIDERAVA